MDIIGKRVKQFELEEKIDEKLMSLTCYKIINSLLLKLRYMNRQSTREINNGGWINMFSLVNKDLRQKDILYNDLFNALESKNPCLELEKLLDKLV